MDDNTNPNSENSQPPIDSANQASQDSNKTKNNYSFLTPSEAGYHNDDPSKVSAAPAPQPGMTFTPTGGSVSNSSHHSNNGVDDETKESNQPEQKPPAIDQPTESPQQNPPQNN